MRIKDRIWKVGSGCYTKLMSRFYDPILRKTECCVMWLIISAPIMAWTINAILPHHWLPIPVSLIVNLIAIVFFYGFGALILWGKHSKVVRKVVCGCSAFPILVLVVVLWDFIIAVLRHIGCFAGQYCTCDSPCCVLGMITWMSMILFSACQMLNGCAIVIVIAGALALLFELVLRRLGRIFCIAIMLIAGTIVHSALPIKYDNEPVQILKETLIAPIHIANQLAGVTLPSRGRIAYDENDDGSAVRSGTIWVWMDKLLNEDDTLKGCVFIYKFFHFSLWIFVVSLVFSFYSREQLNRLRVKLNAYTKETAIFWKGGDVAECIVDEIAKKTTVLVAVSGQYKKNASELCDARNRLWIESDINRGEDDIVLYADRHYLLSDNAESNLMDAIHLAQNISAHREECGWFDHTHKTVTIYIRLDGIGDTMKSLALCWIADFENRNDKGRDFKIQIKPFEEVEVIACAANAMIKTLNDNCKFVTAGMLGVTNDAIRSEGFRANSSANLHYVLEKKKKQHHDASQAHTDDVSNSQQPCDWDGCDVVLCEYDTKLMLQAIREMKKKKRRGKIYVFCRTHAMAELVRCSSTRHSEKEKSGPNRENGIEYVPFGMLGNVMTEEFVNKAIGMWQKLLREYKERMKGGDKCEKAVSL